MTPARQAVAVLVMFVGIATFGIVTASIASYFVDKDNEEARSEMEDLRGRLVRMESMISNLHDQLLSTESEDGPPPARGDA